jgi:hypothetical protein
MPLSERLRRVFSASLYSQFYLAASLAAFTLNCLHQLDSDAGGDKDNDESVGPVGSNKRIFSKSWQRESKYYYFNGRVAFYSLCLLDVCVRNASLERVLSAVSLNKSQLAQTALLMIVLIYVSGLRQLPSSPAILPPPSVPQECPIRHVAIIYLSLATFLVSHHLSPVAPFSFFKN